MDMRGIPLDMEGIPLDMSLMRISEDRIVEYIKGRERRRYFR